MGVSRWGAVVVALATLGLHSPHLSSWERLPGPEVGVQAAAIGIGGVVAAGWGIDFWSDGTEPWVTGLVPSEVGNPINGSSSVADVVAGAHGYVAVGSSASPTSAGQSVAAVWTSPDGRAWTRRLDPDLEPPTPAIPPGVSTSRGSISSVARGKDGYVAIGSVFAGTFVDGILYPPCCEPTVWTSADGAAWKRGEIDEGVRVNPAISDVIATDHGWIAVGAADQAAAVWTSRTGSVWKPVQLHGVVRGRFDAIVATRGRFVAVGARSVREHDARAAVWTSKDARRWKLVHQAPPASLGEFNDVAAGPAGVVAVGYYGNSEPLVNAAVAVSDDGRRWRNVARYGMAFAKNTWLSSVVVAGTTVLAFGEETVAGDGSARSPFRSESVVYRTLTS